MSKHFLVESEREHYCSPYFVLVANDKDLLIRLNEQFRKQGFIAVAAKPNQHVFYINSEQPPAMLSSKILHLLSEQQFNWPQTSNNYRSFCIARRKLIHALLHRFGLDETLLGYSIMKYMAEHLDCPPKELKPLNQNIYPQVATYFSVNVKQISRAVNYALSKANYKGNTMDMLNTIYCYLKLLASKPDLVKQLARDNRDLNEKEAREIIHNLEGNLLARNVAYGEFCYRNVA